MITRLLAGLAILLTLLAVPKVASHAECGTSTGTGTTSATFFAGANQSPCERDSTAGSPTSTGGGLTGITESEKVCASERRNTLCDGEWARCEDGTIMELTFFYPSDGSPSTYQGSNCPEDAQPHPPRGPSSGDILRAFRRIPLAESVLIIQPPGGATLVNFDTNFYTQAAPFERTVRLLGHRVAFRIRTQSFTWHFGDHTTTTTTEPGAAYPALDVTHRYLHKGTVAPSVDTTWQADYRLDDRPWAPVNGTVTITGASQQLTIKSATPILIG